MIASKWVTADKKGNRPMRSLLTIAIASFLLLTACGNNENTTSSEAATQEVKDKPLVGEGRTISIQTPKGPFNGGIIICPEKSSCQS